MPDAGLPPVRCQRSSTQAWSCPAHAAVPRLAIARPPSTRIGGRVLLVGVREATCPGRRVGRTLQSRGGGDIDCRIKWSAPRGDCPGNGRLVAAAGQDAPLWDVTLKRMERVVWKFVRQWLRRALQCLLSAESHWLRQQQIRAKLNGRTTSLHGPSVPGPFTGTIFVFCNR